MTNCICTDVTDVCLVELCVFVLLNAREDGHALGKLGWILNVHTLVESQCEVRMSIKS